MRAFFIGGYHSQFLREEERDACIAFVIRGWPDTHKKIK